MKTTLFIVTILFFSILASCNRNRKQNFEASDMQMPELKKAAPPPNSNKKEQQKEQEKIPVVILQPLVADSVCWRKLKPSKIIAQNP